MMMAAVTSRLLQVRAFAPELWLLLLLLLLLWLCLYAAALALPCVCGGMKT
jgi:hypothetical protein